MTRVDAEAQERKLQKHTTNMEEINRGDGNITAVISVRGRRYFVIHYPGIRRPEMVPVDPKPRRPHGKPL